MADGIFDRIQCKELSIVDDDNKQVAVIAPAQGGAGIWIHSPYGQMAVMFATKESIGIGLYGADQESMPIVLTLDENDGPIIQVRIHDRVLEINSKDLERLDKLGFTRSAQVNPERVRRRI